ncbi:cellulase family glycosylhydrolase [Chitinophaga silvatica]|uniref:cellulase family glycosylhydrolase n=1 Tax=Chitinophaga silvatica TaxID=2282649 RepID=UPI001313FC5E|nr:cellulase family glycosylhydrolase [Chitinophaga silvatica]
MKTLYLLLLVAGLQLNSYAQHPGLTVSKQGELLLNGKPYKGIGVNYFNAFSRTLEKGAIDDTSYRDGFRYLKERNIPFVRFMCSGFWPVNYTLYLKDKEQYFRNLDEFVKSAEEIGIGLIPSLCWNFTTIPDLVKEPVGQWGNPKSKTIAFMRQYVKEIVSRYKQSPAIWGWEFGNEYNLVIDLPGDTINLPQVAVNVGTPATRSKADKLSTADLQTALGIFGKTIRSLDKHRIIISGNSIPRASAFHLHNNKNWEKDSRAEFQQMLDLQNPSPINTLSIHHYPDNENEYFNGSPASLKDIIAESMKASFLYKKPLFIGEFGAQEKLLGVEEAKKKYMELIEGIAVYNVPLSAMWVFDYTPHDTENGINVNPATGARDYMIKAISELNAAFLAK